MRNLLLSVALVAVPTALFAAVYALEEPGPTHTTDAGPPLGDMTPFAEIVTDVQSIAAIGDFGAAEERITDLESAWDQAEPTLQPINPVQWGNVDAAADAALAALRAKAPDPADVEATLTDLQAELADPSRLPGGAEPSGVVTVSGIATTDGNGHSLPCEAMLDTFRAALTTAQLSEADQTAAEALQAKGIERCNADDDTRADQFFAQGLALMSPDAGSPQG